MRTLKVPWFRSGNKEQSEDAPLSDQWRLDAPPSRAPEPARPKTVIPRANPQPIRQEPRQEQRPDPRARQQQQRQEAPQRRTANDWPPEEETHQAPAQEHPLAPRPQQRNEDFDIERRLREIARGEGNDRERPHPHPPHVPVPHEGTLAAEGLQKTYGKRRVVNGVSIDVTRGEAVGILGPNGAGKTTCFYMVTGLVEPDAGQIWLDGHEVTKLPMYRRARLGIGYLPQEASIFRGLNVENNLRAVLEVVEPNRARREQRLEELLDEFHIQHVRKSPSIALSGGERRRVEIARALATNPNYMLLDEPFAGIDPIAVGDIRQLVRHLTGRGIGVLITDHNVRETLSLVDRAYIIHSGSVLMEGTPEEIVESDEVRRLYLGEEFRL